MAVYTAEQHTALSNAISQGAVSVKYGDKEVTYRSLKDMLELQAIMAADIGLLGERPQNRGRYYGEHSKGL